MGKKKSDISAAPASSKSKKKTHIIDDDEYSIVTDLSDNMQMPGCVQEEAKKKAAPAAEESGDGKKRSKTKKGNASDLRGSDFDAMEIEESEDAPVIAFAGKKKPSKSSKKSNSVFSASNFNAIGGGDDNTADIALNSTNDNDKKVEDEGKNKPSKSSKKSISVFSASAIGGDDDGTADIALNSTDANDGRVEDEDDVPAIVFSGKKKSSKSSKKSNSLFTASSFVGGLDDDEAGTGVTMSSTSKFGDEDNDGSQISVSGKKFKPSKKNRSLFTASGFNTVVDDATDGIIGDNQVENEDDAEMIAFSGKKKSSKKSGRSFIASGFDTVMEEEDSGVTESEQPSMDCSISSWNEAGRKKESDGKYNKQGSESVVEPSKKQKKGKKKSAKTAQEEEEEDDLDKILSELGKGPTLPKPTAPLPEEKFQVLPEPVKPPDIVVEEKNTEVVEKEGGQSVAAKKKKKKKEKEKEKKAAVGVEATKVEKQDEKKSKISDQKIPKHVREMQEALARRKEAEERLKKEEEEKLRREEEERRMQEEQERLAEEARRRKKEREKEKLLKKKQEGKLLTHKQKEEAKRLELMRKQYLGDKAQLPVSKIETSSSKRPKFEKRKAKPGSLHGHSGAAAEAVETVEVLENKLDRMPLVFESPEVEMVEEESSIIDTEQQVVEENEIEEDDDVEEWDAKSWDDVDIILPAKSAFPEEEAESMVKKDTKHLTASDSMSTEVRPPPPANPTITTKKAALLVLVKSQDTRSKGEDHEVEEAKEKTERKEAAAEQEQFAADSLSKRSADNLRSPICCILGHVDTGKTKLLDCIRGTKVQEGEAGGITQQIGATYFPAENIRERTKELKADAKLRVPGLLVIDTPGHESFTNLRSRGSGLCDIAILVVDIMHGLEPQTIESINLLKMRKTEFIVALNKVDRLYGWKTCPNAPIVKAMKQQSRDVQNEFKMRLTQIITQFKEQGLNTELYYKNREMGETFSIVPTSAVSGTGIPDLLLLLVQWTQKTMEKKLVFVSEVQCTVLEVKVIEGLGTTVDVVLINGVLHEGDQIVVCGLQGPIVTTIRALLTPHPMKELRIKARLPVPVPRRPSRHRRRPLRYLQEV